MQMNLGWWKEVPQLLPFSGATHPNPRVELCTSGWAGWYQTHTSPPFPHSPTPNPLQRPVDHLWVYGGLCTFRFGLSLLPGDFFRVTNHSPTDTTMEPFLTAWTAANRLIGAAKRQSQQLDLAKLQGGLCSVLRAPIDILVGAALL